MNLSRMPWWLWLIAVLVIYQVVNEGIPRLLPLLVIGWVVWTVAGSSRKPPGRTLGRGGPPQPPAQPQPWPQGRPWAPDQPEMTRIDVPRYPGQSGGAMAGGGGMPSGDPVSSLALLQLGQAGRDLEAARGAGDQQRVRQVLDRLGPVLDQIEGSGASPLTREGRLLRAAVGPLRASVTQAVGQGGDVDPALLDRISAACRRIGQTGGHE